MERHGAYLHAARGPRRLTALLAVVSAVDRRTTRRVLAGAGT